MRLVLAARGRNPVILRGWRVARAFDLAGITNTVSAPFLRVFCEGQESEIQAPSGFDHVSTTKSNSTRSIAAHPCKERKDGAPSVGMMHAKIVNGGPPAPCGLGGRAALLGILRLSECLALRGTHYAQDDKLNAQDDKLNAQDDGLNVTRGRDRRLRRCLL